MLTNTSYLLDTNIVVGLLRGNSAVRARLATAPLVFVSAITLGELYFGARMSLRAAENLRQVDSFAQTTTTLDCDRDTARGYGNLRNMLRLAGHLIPDNDIWIAATALQHSLILVTRDAHCQHVQGLSVEAW